jgi:hypothetical protein
MDLDKPKLTKGEIYFFSIKQLNQFIPKNSLKQYL